MQKKKQKENNITLNILKSTRMKSGIILTGSLLVLISFTAVAQNRPTFGLRAGINFQNINGKNSEGDKLDNKIKTGFHAGINAEMPVGIDFYLQPGLIFTTKGAKDRNIDAVTRLSYIEIPVNLLYKPVLGEGKLLLGFGPYVAVAVGGETEVNGLVNTIEFGGNPGELKRVDAGANMLAGYEFRNKLSVQLNTGLGLINLKNRISSDTKSISRNTGFGVSLCYRI